MKRLGEGLACSARATSSLASEAGCSGSGPSPSAASLSPGCWSVRTASAFGAKGASAHPCPCASSGSPVQAGGGSLPTTPATGPDSAGPSTVLGAQFRPRPSCLGGGSKRAVPAARAGGRGGRKCARGGRAGGGSAAHPRDLRLTSASCRRRHRGRGGGR